MYTLVFQKELIDQPVFVTPYSMPRFAFLLD